jgi:hypothetical protein
MVHLGKRIPLPLEPLPCPTSASHRAFFSVHCSVQICPPPPNQPRWCDPPLRTAVLRPLRPANVCVHPCGSLDLSEKVCCVLQALHGGWIRWSAAAALRRSGAIGPQDCGQVFRRSFWLQAAIACILGGCVCLQQFDAQVYARRCPVSAPARPPRQPTVTALCGLRRPVFLLSFGCDMSHDSACMFAGHSHAQYACQSGCSVPVPDFVYGSKPQLSQFQICAILA